MYYLGFDIGSSSVKAALVHVVTGKCIAKVQEPEDEMDISAPQKGWAEQNPEKWWFFVCKVSKRLLYENKIKPQLIKGIGISYQMHGLVAVDKFGNLLRDAIIWCDSRAVAIGERALNNIGEDICENHLLNSPGNFTASKLKWVQENEPEIYDRIDKIMLPGDFIASKFSGIINTTASGLSEGILWDYKNNSLANLLLDHYKISPSLIPEVIDTFTTAIKVSKEGAEASGLTPGIPISYRAGDQPNNALSLNVFNPGEIAATGGTSGVVYAVSSYISGAESGHINNFMHVNHSSKHPRIGKLLNINGAGIQLKWLKQQLKIASYKELNAMASEVSMGSDGLHIIPFGNGSERLFNNTIIGSHFSNIDLNRHSIAHLCRATLEGIAYAFIYGMELLKKQNVSLENIRVGNDNLFQSEIFAQTIADVTGCSIAIFNTTGAIGAARACDLYQGDFDAFGKIIMKNDYLKSVLPKSSNTHIAFEAYASWEKNLQHILKNNA